MRVWEGDRGNEGKRQQLTAVACRRSSTARMVSNSKREKNEWEEERKGGDWKELTKASADVEAEGRY
jgi:hypothetical protein